MSHQQKQADLWSLDGSSSDDHMDPSLAGSVLRNLNQVPNVRPSDSNLGQSCESWVVQARIVRRATGSYIKKRRQSQRSQRRMRLPANDFSNLSFQNTETSPVFKLRALLRTTSAASNSEYSSRPTDSSSPSSFLQKLMHKSLSDDAERQDSVPFIFNCNIDNVGKTIQISSGCSFLYESETRECTSVTLLA
jgi:hypothetical protein